VSKGTVGWRGKNKFENMDETKIKHVSVGHVTMCQTVRRGGVIRNKWV